VDSIAVAGFWPPPAIAFGAEVAGRCSQLRIRCGRASVRWHKRRLEDSWLPRVQQMLEE
jgi:hypothetical protein